MHRFCKLFLSAAAVSAALLAAPADAQAAKKGPLEGEPVVRNKLQLRKLRFNVTPVVGMSLSQPFVHKGYVGGRLGFHFTDWIGIRAGFMYGAVSLESQLLKDLNDPRGLPVGIPPGSTSDTGQMCDSGAPCRPNSQRDNPAPLVHDFRAGLTEATWQSSVDVVFTPFAGKLGIFSAIFTEYDIYIFGGLGLVQYSKFYEDQSTAELLGLDVSDPNNPQYCVDPSTGAANRECLLNPVAADTGVHVGGSFGAGVHLFITDWVAINSEIQDIVTSNNHTGLNGTVDDIPPRVDNDDKDVFHNVTLQLGAKFYFPPKAKRTR